MILLAGVVVDLHKIYLGSIGTQYFAPPPLGVIQMIQRVGW
jgi:hypothetical protein